MFEELIAQLGKALSIRCIPYMIIGGQAVLLYGEPRMTRDIDITLGVDVDHLDVLLEISKELNLNPLPEDVYMFVNRTMVLPTMDEKSGIRVDFIFSFTSYERGAISRARKISILNTQVNFASPEDVIIHKIFAGRPRDIEDVRSILLKNPGIDVEYIKHWLSKFEESAGEGGFLETFDKLIG